MLGEGDPWAGRKDFLEEVMCQSYESAVSQMAAVNAIPLYPTETILWDDNQVPDVHYTGANLFAHAFWETRVLFRPREASSGCGAFASAKFLHSAILPLSCPRQARGLSCRHCAVLQTSCA